MMFRGIRTFAAAPVRSLKLKSVHGVQRTAAISPFAQTFRRAIGSHSLSEEYEEFSPITPEEKAVNNLLYNTPRGGKGPISKRILCALVSNEPGVLSRLSGVLAGRGFNIDSLVVAATEVPELSRATIALKVTTVQFEQARKQLEDMVQVWAVVDFSDGNVIERELLLCKVSVCDKTYVEELGNTKQGDISNAVGAISSHVKRQALVELTKLFSGVVVDVADEHITIELSAKSSRIDAFLSLLEPYGITESARSGVLAMQRGNLTGFMTLDETTEKKEVDLSNLPPG